MRSILAISSFLFFSQLQAQELFTWSEPASNMAAKSFGFRATNLLMTRKSPAKNEYQLLPEIMWGISGKIMIHVEGFLDNYNAAFRARGAALYFKYRFLSEDDVHSHFRMATYVKAAANNMYVHHPAINLNGENSGYEAGLIATKLINKVAISAGAGFLHATDNTKEKIFPFDDDMRNAVSYNLSFGKLMLPKEYKSYNQTNMNLMLELLGQANPAAGKTYLDLAPTVQFILLSRMRIDAGYRFALIKDLKRISTNIFLLRLEYNIFNAYK